MNLNNYIDSINKRNEKVLSVFLTAGYPNKKDFVKLAVDTLDAGADMLEIGIPFSDPLADGPVIQHSSQKALENGLKIEDCFNFAKEITSLSNKPVVFMSYLNPILSYGINRFNDDMLKANISGVIIPDLVIEEYYNILNENFTSDVILLSTPNTPVSRLKQIDKLSKGFIYYVSVNGTTGERNLRDENIIKPIQKAYKEIEKNKMLVGFGISNEKSVEYFKDFCDGVIVGSAVVSKLAEDNGKSKVLDLVKRLKSACKIN